MGEFVEYRSEEKPHAPYITFFQGEHGKIMSIGYPYQAIYEGQHVQATFVFPIREEFLKKGPFSNNRRGEIAQDDEIQLIDALKKHSFLLKHLSLDLAAYGESLKAQKNTPDKLNLTPSDKIPYIQYALHVIRYALEHKIQEEL